MKRILEKHVEDAFLGYIESGVQCEGLKKFHWESVHRQVAFPLGIADIVAFAQYGNPCIVEVKRGAINRNAVGQLVGYVAQLNQLVRSLAEKRMGRGNFSQEWYETEGYLVGRSINDEALRASRALGYCVYLYDSKHGKITFREVEGANEYCAREEECSSAILEVAHKTVDMWEGYISRKARRPVMTIVDTAVPLEAHNLSEVAMRTVYKAPG
jgi:hypothetical protein